MSILYASLVGLLLAVAFHLLMRDAIIDHIFGLIVMAHAANLLVFGAGRIMRGAPPVLQPDLEPLADPLPQALVLTAIVISFGVTSFTTVLVVRLREVEPGESAPSPEEHDA